MIYTYFPNRNARQGVQCKTSWPDWCKTIPTVSACPTKDTQPLVKLATFEGNSRAGALKLIYGIELDYDDGGITIEEAAHDLQQAGIRAILHSTYTSTANFPKWHAFLPVSQPYAAQHRETLSRAVDAQLGYILARESHTDKQLFYIGRNPETDYTVIECQGQPLDTLPVIHQAAREFLQQQKAEAQAAQQVQAKALQRARLERLTPGQISVIDAFNEAYDIGTILQNHNYVQKGKRFMSPTSNSGIAGVVLLDCDDGRQRAYSHHGTDPLSNSHANDVFDVFCILEHGGDVKTAIQDAGGLLFVDGNTLTNYNRKAYWQSREAA